MEVPPRPRRPSFVKPLNDGFATHLRLPLVFTSNFGKLLPEYSVLEISSGSSWRVKIEVVAEHHCFTQGWPEFVKDLRLELRDFLVFWFKHPSKFSVGVYDKSGRAKSSNMFLEGKVSPKVEEEMPDSGPAPENCVRNQKNLSFSIIMKPSNKYRVTIPAGFLRECEMQGNICTVLRDPKGQEWPVLLGRHGTYDSRIDMAKGWKDFREANGLVDGDTCTFDPIENHDGCWLIQVHVERANPTSPSVGRPKKR